MSGSSDASNEWDAVAADWDGDATRAYADAVARLVDDATRRHGVELAVASVCDFGCGTGLLTEWLAPRCRHVDAVDTSVAMLERLDAKVVRHGWTGVATGTHVPGDDYDLVVCSSVLAFVDDLAGTIRDLVAALRPGGLFLQTDWERDPGAADGVGFTVDEMRDALVAAGLTGVEVGPAFEISFEGHVMRPLAGFGRASGT